MYKPLGGLDLDFPSDLSALQKQNPTLQPWFDKAREGSDEQNVSFLDDAIWPLYQNKKQIEALALPQQFRNKLMKLGTWSFLSLGGSRGFSENFRIGNWFAWPGMYTQISPFCRFCETCQLTSLKGVACSFPWENRGLYRDVPLVTATFTSYGLGMDFNLFLVKTELVNLSPLPHFYKSVFKARNLKERKHQAKSLHWRVVVEETGPNLDIPRALATRLGLKTERIVKCLLDYWKEKLISHDHLLLNFPRTATEVDAK